MDLRDNRDVPITEGCEVAYNLSGELAAGVVESIKPRTAYGNTTNWSGEPYVWIRVRLSHRAQSFQAGHISKVTNPKNLLVIGR